MVNWFYLTLVVLPLLACVSSPAWLTLTTHRSARNVGALLGMLAVGWLLWFVALMGTLALARVYETLRRPGGTRREDLWHRIAIRGLLITGGLGVTLSLLFGGLVAAVSQ